MYNPVSPEFSLVIKALFMLLLNNLPNERKRKIEQKKKESHKYGDSLSEDIEKKKLEDRNNVIHW